MNSEESSSVTNQLDGSESPKHSQSVQSTLKELDGKLKAMLILMEEDADSSVQRAEIYYHKHPELMKMIDEFDRAYKHLTKQYDQPDDSTQSDDLEVPDSSDCDSKGNLHSEEEIALASSDSEGDDSVESDKIQQILYNLEQENNNLKSHCHVTEEENAALNIRVKELEGQVLTLQGEKTELADKCFARVEDVALSAIKMKELEEELSRLQEINGRLVEETVEKIAHLRDVQSEVRALREEKHVMKEEIIMGKNEMDKLQREVKSLQVESSNFRAIALNRAEELQALENSLRQLQEENKMLVTQNSAISEQSKVAIAVSKFLRGVVYCLVEKNKKIKDEIMVKASNEAAKSKEITCLQEEKRSLTMLLEDARVAEIQRVSDLNRKLNEFHGQVTFLTEENKKQKLVLLDRAEEKREAIRQLCFSMDVLKEENQRLEEALCSAKMRLNTGFRNATSSSYHWKKLFLGAWNAPRPHSYALAL